MIELQDLGKRYGHRPGVVALDGVTLTVAAGEVCAVVGPNGAGKSTLLGLVLGFLRRTTGKVLIEGEPPRWRNRQGGVAYLPERFALPREWRVRQALRGLAALDGEPDAAGRVARAIARFGLETSAEREVGVLSRGTLQRVGLAQAWLAPARVVVLDEPTEGLDPLWRLQLRELIAERRADGAAVLIASHDLAEVERIADRVVLLDRGRIRQLLAARAPAGAGGYRLQVIAGAEHVAAVFPDAVTAGADAFLVQVADAHELSTRLAALLERGAVLGAVQPTALEDRIRPAYEGDAP